MILILSYASDTHAQVVLQELKQMDAPAMLLDLADFPQRICLEIAHNGRAQPTYVIALSDGRRLSLNDCGAIWWRRPQSFQIHDEVQEQNHRAFAYTESVEAFTGLWQGLDTFWINHPVRDTVAHRKVYQLHVASEVGLRAPETLITNDPDAAHTFIESNGHDRTIYKAFSATMRDWRETRVLRAGELALLDSVKYAPVIFQEYIDATVDLRITVVGDTIFPAAIHSQETRYKIDFRMDMERAHVEPHELPDEVEYKLRALMERLGLVYGAIDMRLTPEGNYVFLEINPAGQWYFIEERTGQPITRTLARLLAMHAVPSRDRTAAG